MRPQASLVRLTTAVAVLFAAIAAALLMFASAASATTPTPAPNPDLKASCGANVVLILDESSSIGHAGAVQSVRDAANAFASGLTDTGSKLAVIEFGGSAKRVFDYTPVTSGAGGTLATQFQPYFNGTAAPPADVYALPTQTGPLTNWEAALAEVASLNTGPSGFAPLVVFITDGDPTTTNAAGGAQIPSGTAVLPAITQANIVKGQGSHILAVGVGAALSGDPGSINRLKQVSGPNVATSAAGLDLAATDVLLVSDFNDLPSALQAVVQKLCSLGITKTVDKPVVTPGTTVTWTITVTNTGDIPLSNVAVADPIAKSCERTIGNLASHASTSFTCTSVINADTTNVATVTGTDSGGHVVTKNASASVKVTPNVSIVGTQTTRLAIDKRGPSTAKTGSVITYSVKITNKGAVTADNVVMRDKIPMSMALAKRTPGVQLVKGYIVIQVGKLAPGASKTFKLQLRIDRIASGLRTNTASASASNAATVKDSAPTRIVQVSGRVIVPRVTG